VFQSSMLSVLKRFLLEPPPPKMMMLSKRGRIPIVLCIVVHGAVRTVQRHVAGGLDLSPLHGGRLETPHIIHVVRVCLIEQYTCIATKEDHLVLDHAACVAPSRHRCLARALAHTHLLPSALSLLLHCLSYLLYSNL
jgi:hypothetical protein